MIKKHVLSIMIGLIAIIACFSLFRFHNTELKKSNQAIATLTKDLAALKAEYALYTQSVNSRFDLLANNPAPTQTATQVQPKAKHSLQPTNQESVSLNRSPEPTPTSSIPNLAPEDVLLNAWFTTGKAALEKRNFTKAREAFSQLLDINPPLWEAQLYYIQAAYCENAGKAAADKTVERLLDALPQAYNKSGAVTKWQGLLALERGAYGEAANKLTEYKTFGKEAESLLALGECYLALQKQDAARGVFVDVIASFPGTAQAGMASNYIKKIR